VEGGTRVALGCVSSREAEKNMSVRSIFQLQIVVMILLFALTAAWYWAPRLAGRSLGDALIPLLLVHLTRVLGLTLLVPTVVDPNLPRDFADQAAYGDLIAAGLALLSIVALRTRQRFALAVVWVFTLWGVGDLVNAFVQGDRIELGRYQLGAGWYIFTVMVPALLVTHFMVAARLVRHAREGGGVLLERTVAS
jgi:hypothetical protein